MDGQLALILLLLLLTFSIYYWSLKLAKHTSALETVKSSFGIKAKLTHNNQPVYSCNKYPMFTDIYFTIWEIKVDATSWDHMISL